MLHGYMTIYYMFCCRISNHHLGNVY